MVVVTILRHLQQ